MRALVKPGPEPGFLLTDVPIPSIGPTDVLIRVEKAGLCGTDQHIYTWDNWAQHRIKPPLIVGHEFMGTVAAIGDAVRSVRVGERVSAEGHIADLTCLLCRTGQAHICERVQIVGVDRDGAFAEYVAIPEYNVWRLDPAIPDEYAAIFDPLGNAVHTVMAAGVSVKSVAITGVGSIGLMAIPVARAAGATAVYAIDINPAKLELARQLGADATFLSTQSDLVAEIRSRTRGDGVDVLLEMSGSASAIDLGLQLVRDGGAARYSAGKRQLEPCRADYLQGIDSPRRQRSPHVRDVVSDRGAAAQRPSRSALDHHPHFALHAVRARV